MSMPQDPATQGGPPPGPGGGGSPIHMLIQLAQQAADAINQLGQALTQMAGPQGPPPGAGGPGGPPPGGGGGGDPRAAALQAMIQRGG